MASIGVSGAAAAFSWNPFLAAGAIAIASYLDQQYLYPALLGEGKEQARPRPLIGLPTTTNTPGSPRVWAVGRRVRLPAHIMYQSEKEREDTISGPKGGVAGRVKRVFADVGLSINDRQTSRLTQLIANGQLIYWSDKNLVNVTSSEMTCSMNTTVVASGTAAAGSSASTIIKSGGGMTQSSYTCNYKWVKFTSGTLNGKARSIFWNSATNINLAQSFASAPSVGDSFDIIEQTMTVQMNSSYEPDFADYFVVGDIVDLRNFSSSTGSLFGVAPFTQKSWWRVNAVTRHAAVPSSVVLEAMNGQVVPELSGVAAGSSIIPASVVREDQYFLWAAVFDSIYTTAPSGARPWLRELWNTTDGLSDVGKPAGYTEMIASRMRRFLGTSVRKRVRWYNGQFGSGLPGSDFGAINNGSPGAYLTEYEESTASLPESFSGAPQAGIDDVTVYVQSSNNTLIAEEETISNYEGRMFVSNPGDWFYQGTDGQEENGIILKTKTSGQVPGFRGMAYQMLEQWDLSTYFGNQVPPIIEAIVEPDLFMTIPQAVLEICERAQSRDLKFDTNSVDVAPFEGYWTQGAIPTVTALQPLLTAYQIAAQERNDTLVFFNIENADAVQIENGASFSDLGVQSGADTPFAGDKVKITQRDVADLPTSIGVTHQDPDQQYSQGYQNFKQRQPSPLPSANEQNVNLDNIVLSRKQARNLAGTIMRRAWVNSTALEFQLPVAYMELLENDLVTLTTDDGQDFTARIIRREIGNNFVVNVYAVVEDVALAVRGSPVQGPSDIVIGTPAVVTPSPRILDIPPLVDGDAFVPGYYVGGSSASWQGAIVYESRDGGSNWTQVATLNTQCGMGTTTTTLPSGTPADYQTPITYDTTNSFTVAIERDNVIPLVTVGTSDVEAGWNWMLVEDGTNFEILGARDVVDNGDGTYTFDYLLRGLRGTYDSCATTKAIGSKVTFLYQARQLGALQFVPVNLSAASLPTTIQVKVVASGQSLVDVTAETVTLDCWNARPMPGFLFLTELNVSTFDRTFLFDHWTRLQSPVGSGTPYPLDESFEGYTVNFYDPTGATLLRTKTISAQNTGSSNIRGAREFTYTAAEQTADGYTPGALTTFKVERFQLGDFGNGRTWLETV